MDLVGGRLTGSRAGLQQASGQALSPDAHAEIPAPVRPCMEGKEDEQFRSGPLPTETDTVRSLLLLTFSLTML